MPFLIIKGIFQSLYNMCVVRIIIPLTHIGLSIHDMIVNTIVRKFAFLDKTIDSL